MSTAHVRNYQYHHPTVRQYPSLCPSSSGTAPSRAAISEPVRRQSLPSRSAVSSTPHKFPSWRSHPQSSEVYCCPKWKLLLPKVEVRCLSAARLESANLNTLPKWKGAIIKSICSQSLNCGAHQRAAHYHNCGAHQSLNCGAHQRAAHYHAPCTPPSPWRSASGLARPSAGRLVGASPRGTVRRSHLGAIRGKAISGNQWQSVAIRRSHLGAIRGNQRQSEAISGNQWQSGPHGVPAHMAFSCQ